MIRVRELGWFYIPRTWLAWIIAVAMCAFCVHVFMAVDAQSHSATDTLYAIFPSWAAAFLLWNWVGSHSCKDC